MSDPKSRDKKNSITEQQVRDYLRQHNDFFVRHPDILTELDLPHESGDAISLVERQVSLLRERNIEMRHRISKLLDNAKDNDRLFDKTRRLILMLMEARSLTELVDTLYFSFDRDFAIPYSSVLLFGDPERIPDTQAAIVSLGDARDAAPRLIGGNRILCGDLQPAELQFLFAEQAGAVGSAAVVPLVHGTCFGLFAVGNPDPNHYRLSHGTLFLSYIGEALNRLLPKYLNG